MDRSGSCSVSGGTAEAYLNFAAACAQGARLFEDSDSAYAKTLKDAAVKAFKAAQDQYAPFTGFTDTGLYAPMVLANKGGGPYGDDNVSDEFYWAACELYITTTVRTYTARTTVRLSRFPVFWPAAKTTTHALCSLGVL